MFKSNTSKKVIRFTQMKNDQFHHSLKTGFENNEIVTDTSTSIAKTTSSMKRLAWDEM